MTLTIRHPTLTNPADRTELEENFADITNKFGAITNADIGSGDAIDVTKLSAYYQEVYIQLCFHGNAAAGEGYSDLTLNVPCDAVPIPGTNGDTAWVLTDLSWVTNDVGTVAGVWELQTGTYTAAGATWTGTTVTGSSTTMTIGTNNAGAHGKTIENGSVSIAYTATNPVMLALVPTTAGTAVCNVAGSFVRATARLRRVLQAA